MDGKCDVAPRDSWAMTIVPRTVLLSHEGGELERDVESCQAEVSERVGGRKIHSEALRSEGGREKATT